MSPPSLSPTARALLTEYLGGALALLAGEEYTGGGEGALLAALAGIGDPGGVAASV